MARSNLTHYLLSNEHVVIVRPWINHHRLEEIAILTPSSPPRLNYLALASILHYAGCAASRKNSASADFIFWGSGRMIAHPSIGGTKTGK